MLQWDNRPITERIFPLTCDFNPQAHRGRFETD